MIVLDSNVVSYIFRNSSEATYYLQQIAGLRAVISFQTLEEVWYGAYYKSWGARKRNELAQFLEQFEVVYPDDQMADICAQLRAERRAAGREMQVADAWVAATALRLGWPIAAHDADFVGIPDLQLIRDPSL